MTEWISVKDRFPNDYEYVLLNALKTDVSDDPLVFVGCKCGKRWESAWGDGWTPFQFDEIVFWAPLPEPPND